MENTKLMKVTAPQLHFRKGPSTADYIIKTLNKGDVVLALGPIINGWAKVIINFEKRFYKKEGYVSASYITEISK